VETLAMQWTDEVQIETPEQIGFGLELAGVGSRFLAQVLDWLIKGCILFLLAFVTFVLLAMVGLDVFQRSSNYLIALMLGMGFAIVLGFDIYFEVRHNGQTPGKRLAQIRVVREGGAPVDFTAAAVRNLLGLVDWLPSFYLLGGLLVMVNARSQRLGDMAAGTIVVRDRQAEVPLEQDEEYIDKLARPEHQFTAEQLRACAPGDRFIIRSYFLRTAELDRRACHNLAWKLADQFCAKLSYALPMGNLDLDQAEQFLASLYRDLKALARHGA